MTNNENIYNEQLARYLSGEMNPDEASEFRKDERFRRESDPELELLGTKWNAMEDNRLTEQTATRKAWNDLHERIKADDLLPAEPKPARNHRKRSWMVAAAIFMLLVGSGTVLYRVLYQTTAPELLRLSTASESGTLVQTLSDGSIVYMAGNSEFSFPKTFENNKRSVSLRGKAFFDIARDPDRPFVIETNQVIVRVLGTAFTVDALNNSGFELVVERGRVEVSLKSDPSATRIVNAGERISVSEGQLLSPENSGSSASAWYRQKMHFKDETLGNIVQVLNRNYATKFAVADQATAGRRLTLTFRNDDEAMMTELICATLNLKSTTVNGSVVLSGK
jgi:ferric-dicitrate binding protein FerR (iron transport regulator)